MFEPSIGDKNFPSPEGLSGVSIVAVVAGYDWIEVHFGQTNQKKWK